MIISIKSPNNWETIKWLIAIVIAAPSAYVAISKITSKGKDQYSNWKTDYLNHTKDMANSLLKWSESLRLASCSYGQTYRSADIDYRVFYENTDIDYIGEMKKHLNYEDPNILRGYANVKSESIEISDKIRDLMTSKTTNSFEKIIESESEGIFL